jgi:hypothetical protein
MTIANNSKTIHELMQARKPVTYDGIQYERITEYVSWYDDLGKHHLSVTLLLNNYTIRVPADKITL